MRLTDISIHTPREGSDDGTPGGSGKKYISIHTPREGSDRKKLSGN